MNTLFDPHTVALVFLVALVGGVIGLDRTAVGQIMVSQPIVAGPVTGWMLGDPAAGIVIGGLLELIWVLDMPVGTFVPADATVGAVAATAIAVLSSRGSAAPDVLGFCMLLTVAMVPLTMMADRWVRECNSGLVEAACARESTDPAGRITRAHLSGLVFFFLKSFVLYLLLVPAGLAAVGVFRQLPAPVHAGMALFIRLLPFLGAALVLHKLSIAFLDRFLVLGFAVASIATLLLDAGPIVVVCCVVAAGIAGARLQGQRSARAQEERR